MSKDTRTRTQEALVEVTDFTDEDDLVEEPQHPKSE